MHRHIRRRIQPRRPHWVPACAGTTTLNGVALLAATSQHHRRAPNNRSRSPPARHSGAGRNPESTCVAAPCAAPGTGLRQHDDTEPGGAFPSDIAAPPPEPEKPQPKPHPPVIPAQAGIQKTRLLPHHAPLWVPACAGTTTPNRVAPLEATSRHHRRNPNNRRRSPTRPSFLRRPESSAALGSVATPWSALPRKSGTAQVPNRTNHYIGIH